MHVNYVHFIEQTRRLESLMCTVSIKGQCHEICISPILNVERVWRKTERHIFENVDLNYKTFIMEHHIKSFYLF